MANCLFCGDWTCCDGKSGSNYTLPIATQTKLGGVLVGTGLNITADGILSCAATSGSLTAEDTSETEFIAFVFGED